MPAYGSNKSDLRLHSPYYQAYAIYCPGRVPHKFTGHKMIVKPVREMNEVIQYVVAQQFPVLDIPAGINTVVSCSNCRCSSSD